jgi:hypothetical protein
MAGTALHRLANPGGVTISQSQFAGASLGQIPSGNLCNGRVPPLYGVPTLEAPSARNAQPDTGGPEARALDHRSYFVYCIEQSRATEVWAGDRCDQLYFWPTQ